MGGKSPHRLWSAAYQGHPPASTDGLRCPPGGCPGHGAPARRTEPLLPSFSFFVSPLEMTVKTYVCVCIYIYLLEWSRELMLLCP
jgi:hypothetical protein